MVPYSEERAKGVKVRDWFLELYPDNESHRKAFDLIVSDFDHACILHDRDLGDNGALKKAHWHIIVRCPHPRWMLPFARFLGVELRFLYPMDNIRNRVRYLIHLDSPTKFQYSPDDVITNIRPFVDKCFLDDEEDTEESKVLLIIDMLDEIQDVVETRQFIRLICKAGLYSVYRRSQFTFLQILKDHNRQHTVLWEQWKE